jgi:transcriptional regulator with XRE-family HTH domain
VGPQEPATTNDAAHSVRDGKLVNDIEPVEAEFVMASRWFGENLKYVRERMDESQTGLAKRMADLGFPFHQTTISRIEAGERPVQLGEALALAEIVGMGVDVMIRRPSDVRLSRLLTRATRRVADALVAIETNTTEAILAKTDLEGQLDAARDAGLDDAQLMDTAADWLAREPETAVQAGRASAEFHMSVRNAPKETEDDGVDPEAP